MVNFYKYQGNHFGKNINLGFFEKCDYLHLFLNVPNQVYYGQNSNVKLADFIRAGLAKWNYTDWTHRDILAVKKWNKRYPNRVSCFIKGSRPKDSPSYFKWNCTEKIQLRVFHDDINETQSRMFEIPKCWNCFEIGHDVYQCSEFKAARYNYRRKINANANLSPQDREQLMMKWRFVSNRCGKCGKKGHQAFECYGSEYCNLCKCDSHRSGGKSAVCKELKKIAIATYRFNWFFQMSSLLSFNPTNSSI